MHLYFKQKLVILGVGTTMVLLFALLFPWWLFLLSLAVAAPVFFKVLTA